MPIQKRRRTKIFKKQRRIEVSVQRTVNLGNFESLKVQAGYSESIKESTDIDTAYNDAWNTINYQIDTAIESHLNEGVENVSKETYTKEQSIEHRRMGVLERITISNH